LRCLVVEYSVEVAGEVWADAGLVEQRRCERADVGEDLAFELGGLGGCRFDAAGEAAEHLLGGEFVGWS
jgi:hypothetical protein